MRCILKKIIIKYSFILFVFLAVIDASFGAETLPFFDARGKENIPLASVKMNAQGEGDSIEKGEASVAGQENPDCCATLQEFGLSRREALSVHLKNNALFIEMRKKERSSAGSPSKFQKTSSQKTDSEFEIDLTALSPAKMRDFCAEGGDLSRLEREIRELKTQYPSPIRNTTLFPRSDGHVFSPSVREALSRPQLQVARKEGAVRKLFPIAHQEPVDEETEEERLARKEVQERDFLESERRRGKIQENLHEEIQKEFEIWQDYLNYIKLRKNQLFGEEESEKENITDDEDEEDNEGVEEKDDREEGIKKIRKGEIEDAFFRFVAPKLTRLEIDGYDVYFTKETLDLDRTYDNVMNWENMELGNCPIGPDQKPMNFHHLTHHDHATHNIKSIIVLITQTLHTSYSGSLHFSRTTYRDLPRKKVIRTLFNLAREAFNRTIVASLYPPIII